MCATSERLQKHPRQDEVCTYLKTYAAAFDLTRRIRFETPVLLVDRSGPIPFTTMSMGVGATCLILISLWRGSFAPVGDFGGPQWLAAIYLGALGSALTFYLWAFALGRTTPTRVAISVTVNPITASLVGTVLLHESIRWSLVGGIVTVFIGIWIATTVGRKTKPGDGDVQRDA